MTNAREENGPPPADAPGTPSNEEAWCPSWCLNSPNCDGDHLGQLWGTVATGGLPPVVDSIDPPEYDTVCVRAQFPESSKLQRGVALFGAWGGEDWEVALTPDEAVALARALEAAIDKALLP